MIPPFAVRESLRPKAEQIHSVYGQPCMVQVRDRLIPLLHLGDALRHRRRAARGSPAPPSWSSRTTAGRSALVVDELIGKQEVVIKSLGGTFEGVRGVAGGAILGDGRVGLILDAGGLSGLLGKGAAHHAA